LKIAERPINRQKARTCINPNATTRPAISATAWSIRWPAFLKFDDYSQASYRPDRSWHRMFAPGFAGETMEVAEFAQAPQWLAYARTNASRSPSCTRCTGR
jgi:hypothetical protein